MPSSAKHLWLLQAVAVILCLVYFWGEAPGVGFPLDDSWIHLQFARNLAAGQGLSYQYGELVMGSTAPLWTALLSLVFLLPAGQFLAVKALGVLFYLASVHAVYLLCQELRLGHGLALLAAGLFLATNWMVWSALSGMEISLFVWLSLWGLILQARERLPGDRLPLALPLFAVATLVRPEGFLLLLLAAVDRLVVFGEGPPARQETREARQEQEEELQEQEEELQVGLVTPRLKPLLYGLGLAVLVLLPTLLFYRLAGDSWLPTTFAVKTEGVRHLTPSARNLYESLGILFQRQPFMLLLASAGILRLLERVGTSRDRGLLPALWLLALPLAYSTLGRFGNFGRYLFPLFAPLIVLGVLGLEPVVHRLTRMRWGLRLPVGFALLLLLLWPTAATLTSGRHFYALNVRNVRDSDVEIGRWIGSHLPRDAVLAVQDIGAIKYLAPNPIIDLAGIVNPEILPYIKGPLVGSHPSRLGGLFHYLQEKGADFLVLYPNSYPHLENFVHPKSGLKEIHRVSLSPLKTSMAGNPGPSPNVTMAGDELVVYLTPWSRFGFEVPDSP